MYNHMVFDGLHKQYRPVIYTIIFFKSKVIHLDA